MANVDAYVLDWVADEGPLGSPTPTPVHTALVFDMRNPCGEGGGDAVGQWYTWPLPGDVVAATEHAGVHYYLTSDGRVHYETPDQYYDDESAAILPRVSFAPLSLGNIRGFERIHRIQGAGTWVGASSIQVTASITYGNGASPSTWQATIDMSTSAMQEFEVRPSPTRMTNIELIVEETETGNLTGGWRFKVLGLEMSVRGRMMRLPVSQKVSG